LSKALASSLLLTTVIAGSSGAQSPPPSSGANEVQFTQGVIFNTIGDGSEHIRKMRERLQDPQQRAAVRVEHRGYIVDANYDVADVLELDASTYEKFMDLLVDQQMAQLDAVHLRDSPPTSESDIANHLQSHVERQNQEIEALRALLGQEKLARYQQFQLTLGERREVRELDEYLKPSDKLSRTQKERLIELFHESQQRRILQDHHSAARLLPSLGALRGDAPSPEELQRRSQLLTIEANENVWRRTPEANRQLQQQAAAFLTAAQLSQFEQLHADKLQQLQQSIEHMRAQAGLSPNIPAAVEAPKPTVQEVTRAVRVRIKIAVNKAKPSTFTEVVNSGTPFTFEMDEGLLVEATPTVFDNDTYALHVEYFEQAQTGKRLIGNIRNVGTLSRPEPGDDWIMGGGSSVVVGSKAYAVELSARVVVPIDLVSLPQN
jgi:hypothetical protein